MASKKTSQKWGWIGGGGLLLIGLLGAFIYFPPSFVRLQEVVLLQPPRTLTEAALIRLAEVHVGQNLMTLSLRKVKANLKRHHWIEDVKLSKRFPGRLMIEVKEAEPVGVVALGDLYYVNRQGELFKKMGSADPKDFPVITGFDRETLEKESERYQPLLQRMIGLLDLLSQSNEVRQLGLSELHWEEGRGVQVITLHPYLEISLGSEDWEEKLSRFSRGFSTLQAGLDQILSIDLNFEKKIVVKTKI